MGHYYSIGCCSSSYQWVGIAGWSPQAPFEKRGWTGQIMDVPRFPSSEFPVPYSVFGEGKTWGRENLGTENLGKTWGQTGRSPCNQSKLSDA